MSYLIDTDLISSLLDLKHIDPGSTLIYIGTYGPKFFNSISETLAYNALSAIEQRRSDCDLGH